MSSANAIAAVTATLRNLLAQGVALAPELADVSVTTLPMDRARDRNNNANQLNVFLYQTTPNAAWRNMDMPGRVGRFETGTPPLALNLYYLITAYGRDDDAQSPFSHLLLGQAMSLMNDHPLLGRDEIRLALQDNDLYLQLERIRFSLQPLTVEEIFKLWSGFQTQYRLSASYEASVVLIDSAQPARAPLPVLARGRQDRGPFVQASLTPPFPAIDGVSLASGEPAATLPDTLTITGSRLASDAVEVVFEHPRLPAPIILPPNAGGSDSRIEVTLSNDDVKWLAGLMTVSVRVTSGPGTLEQRVQTTNAWPLPVAPVIASRFPLKGTLKDGVATLKLSCTPAVAVEQYVALLLGDREIAAEPRKQTGSDLSFVVRGAPAGSYLVRMRVDGVDSPIIDRTTTPPTFRQQTAVLK